MIKEILQLIEMRANQYDARGHEGTNPHMKDLNWSIASAFRALGGEIKSKFSESTDEDR